MSRRSSAVLAGVAFMLGAVLMLADRPHEPAFTRRLQAEADAFNVTSTEPMPFTRPAALDALASAHAPASDYWHFDIEAEQRRLERIREAERAARMSLIDQFGSHVADAAFLWRLFRPLSDRMPQLSSPEQIAIRELEQQFAAESLAADNKLAFGEHLLRVRERLGDEIADEYALHTSPLAKELRNAGFELSETDFRAAFAALNAFAAATSPQEALAAGGALREVLGSRRAAEFRARSDPRFARFASTALRFELSEDQTMTAWTLLLEAQDSMLALLSNGPDAGTQARLRSQYEDLRRRLQELAGARAADMLLQVADPIR